MASYAFKMLLCSLICLMWPDFSNAAVLQVSPVGQHVKMRNSHISSKLIKPVRSARKIIQWRSDKNKIRQLILQKWGKTNGGDIQLMLLIGVSLSLFVLTVVGLVWIAQFIASWLTVLLVISTLILAVTGLIFILTV